MNELGPLRWPEVPAGLLLVVPVGSCEQHGPHLPLDTDARVATAVASGIVAAVPATIIAPTIPYGASGEHSGFAGTLSIGQQALESVLTELIRSADHFAGVVVVNGHGGNTATLRRVVATAGREGRRVLLVGCDTPDGDAHAGRAETSMLLHLSPEVVRMDLAAPGSTAAWPEIAERVRAEGVAAVSPNGVLGDPQGATAEEGAELIGSMVGRGTSSVEAWVRDGLPTVGG